MRAQFALLVVLLAVACKPAVQQAQAPAAAASANVVAGPVAGASAVALAAAGKARSVSIKNDLFEFTYAYPAAAGAIPALKARFEDEIASNRKKLIADARQARAEAGKDGFPFHGFEGGTSWQVVAELPGWLAGYEQSAATRARVPVSEPGD